MTVKQTAVLLFADILKGGVARKNRDGRLVSLVVNAVKMDEPKETATTNRENGCGCCLTEHGTGSPEAAS